MSLPNRLLARGQELLRKVRSERGAWAQLSPARVKDADGHESDAREADRMQLAWALQYDARPEDGELLRFLLAQEIEWRRVAPFQGIGETLELLAWLVARERNVGDVWLLAQAKRANFDTSCGFDREHLIAAGVAATLAHVREAEPAVAGVPVGCTTELEGARDRVLELLLDEQGAPAFEEGDVAAWISAKEAGFPRQVADESIETWLNRAQAIGDREAARQLLAGWSAGCERDVEHLGALASHLAQLGEHEREADVRTERMLLLSTPFDRASERCRIASAERLAGRWQRALDNLDHAALLHRPRPAWRELGLGRDLVREAFELAATGPETIARAALALGQELAAQTPRLPPAALEQQARAVARFAR